MKRRVEIIDIRTTDLGFYKIEEARLRHERFDGSMSRELTRLNLRRGDAVAAIVHNRQNDTLIFTEQFRYPTYAKGHGWLLELPKGVTWKEDSDPADTMRREILEEIGYSVHELAHIHTFFVSPGGSSERIHLYYASVLPGDQITAGGGVPAEGEDIRVLTLSISAVLKKLAAGEINDAITIIGLQWLQLHLSTHTD